jgi:hypothetical protein
MEVALKSILKDHLSEYVKGRALEKADLNAFPLVFRDLQLNEKKVQEFWDEDHDSATELTSGKIGMVKVTPGWLGTVDVHVTNIDLSFSFSATKALANSMKPEKAEEWCDSQTAAQSGPPHKEQRAAPGPPPLCPPRFCSAHDTSEKRVKCEPRFQDCGKCGIRLQSSYKDFKLCPPCSEQEQKCMICGSHAPQIGNYIPAGPQGQSNCNGTRSTLPPPPPPPLSARQPTNHSRPDVPASLDNTSMYLSHPAASSNMNSMRLPGSPPTNTGSNPGQVFSTQLPPQSGGNSGTMPPPRTPWEQKCGSMSARPYHKQALDNHDDDGLAGFLRFVAADIWKTCSSDNRRLDSPETGYVRRGGA